jgi:hypothetical protein
VLSNTAISAGLTMAILMSGSAAAQGIYTCVDSKGHKITSDRPIAECMDRTQREISPSGAVKRVIGPSLTSSERAVLEAKERQAAEVRAQQAEEKRRDRALALRYPNKETHDGERALALAQIDEVVKAAVKRMQELSEQRKSIDTELEFYKKDVNKAPTPLRRRLEENQSNVAAQKRFIADQEVERRRVNQRFDDELAKLRQLWVQLGTPGYAAPIAAGADAVTGSKSARD